MLKQYARVQSKLTNTPVSAVLIVLLVQESPLRIRVCRRLNSRDVSDANDESVSRISRADVKRIMHTVKILRVRGVRRLLVRLKKEKT